MSVQIKTPNITAGTDRERLQQIQSYLYQMAQQLQWAFDNIGTAGSGSGTMQQAPQTGGKPAAVTVDPASTFGALKNLIIKSADIVNAYYDTISSRLEGVYVAQSDFGIYAQKTALEIEGNSEEINQLYTNEQTIVTRLNVLNDHTRDLAEQADGLAEDGKALADSLEELYSQTILTNAYIKTGLIDYAENGVPIYGLEIGQTNSLDGQSIFDKFARFSSDRLSFFDSNDVEVAYISDYKLYITNAEISGTLYLSGRFKIYYNGGLAFQWIGGEN